MVCDVNCPKIKENRVPYGWYFILSLNKIDDPNSKEDGFAQHLHYVCNYVVVLHFSGR